MAPYRKNNSGQSLVEFLVAIGIASAVLPVILSGFIAGREGKVSEDLRLRATSFVKEAQEATRIVRESNWNTFAVNGTYHPVILGNTWSLVSGPETVSDFTRSVIISDIVPVDPSIKLVTITVSWGSGALSSVSSQEYFTRYVGNNVRVGSGTVQPAAGGNGDWCKPDLVTNAWNLDKSGKANAISAIEGRVFAGTGDNSSGVSFDNVSITNTRPPVPSTLGTFNDFKTNDIFGETDYAYLATDTNNKEIEIVNLKTNPYSEVGWFDSPGPTDANSIYVVGNIGYMTAGSNFYTFDLSSKTASRNQLGSVNLAGTGNAVYVVGSYAYIATSSNTAELQIINVSDPAHPGTPVSVNVNGNGNVAAGKDVFVNATGTRAYLVTANSSSPEFFIVNITNKTSPMLVSGGTYDTSGMDPYGVTVVSNNKAVAVGHNAKEYQVINIASENSPSSCGVFDVDSGINGVSSVLESDGDAYSYIITGDSNAELKIIEGGPGGGGGGGTGTFESSTFDAGHDVAFNYFSATADPNLTYKIAIKHGSGGNCGSVTFTDSDFVSFSPGPLPLATIGSGYVNPEQCLKYRVINFGSTPIAFTISFNYSP